MPYTTKAELYEFVANLRSELRIDFTHYPINTTRIITRRGKVCIEYSDFKTRGLCGIAFIGEHYDTIILNNGRSHIEQSFDCAHELIHISKHRTCSDNYFQCCFEATRPSQNSSLEWQANEGAAELLVPYLLLLPYLKNNTRLLRTRRGIQALKKNLADIFNVTETTIYYRLESLKYEICQHLSGTPLNEIEILSNTRLFNLGKQLKSINDLENVYWNQELSRMNAMYGSINITK